MAVSLSKSFYNNYTSVKDWSKIDPTDINLITYDGNQTAVWTYKASVLIVDSTF